MNCNAAGLDIIRRFESCRLTAYKCPAGVWTIGYGHTGDHVVEGMTITRHQADEVLMSDVDRFEREVETLVPFGTNENQFSALVSFAFNCGSGIDAKPPRIGLKQSMLLMQFHAGNLDRAAHEFSHWIHAGGKVLPGLVARRREEAALFLRPVRP